VRKTISIVGGCLVAAALTHGFVSSGVNMTGSEPFFTYRGFFSHVIFAAWRLWTQAHGIAPVSLLHGRPEDLGAFGRFLAFALLLISPLIGFGVAALSCRQRRSWHWLRPLAIATVLALWDAVIRHPAMTDAFRAAGFSVPLAESGRGVVVTLLTLWSAGVMRFRKSPAQKRIPGIVPA
jgi:hypothetical protein